MLDELCAIQKRDKLSDTAMGSKLGVSRSRWNAIRNGKQTLSDNLALTAAGVWPELTRELLNRAAVSKPTQTNPDAERVA